MTRACPEPAERVPRPQKVCATGKSRDKDAVGRRRNKNVTTKSTLTAIGPKLLPPGTHSCWSCGAMRAAHFCAACGKVQPPAPVDYFTFFGLPAKLNIDLPALEKDFYEFSRKLHPDLSARASLQEQQWSLEQSSLLKCSPLKRCATRSGFTA